MRFDLVDYLSILSIFDNINNNSKKVPIGEIIVSVKIKQFYKLIYNQIICLRVLIKTKSINQR